MVIKTHKEDLTKHLGERIAGFLIEHNEKSILLFVSGGSALKVLDEIDPDVLGPNITLSLLDERLDVSLENTNFFQLSQTRFYQEAQKRRVRSVKIGEWPKVNIVAAIMGIGLDGHTAGIMPFPEDENKFKRLFEGEEMFVRYDAGDKNQYPLRLTASISFLQNKVDKAFVHVFGEEKRGILNKVLALGEEVERYPARVLHQMKSVEIYTNIDTQ